jgi:hypothetical protein
LPPPSARCTMCGSTRGLRSCPWTRSLLVCSAACHTASESQHLAAIALCFCGAAPPSGKDAQTRPSFEAFEPCTLLEAETATELQWLRLAEATPQPERDGAGS